ncbi:MAG: hypothetical protein ABI165_07145 [Bryobacteraceae bacterium]
MQRGNGQWALFEFVAASPKALQPIFATYQPGVRLFERNKAAPRRVTESPR